MNQMIIIELSDDSFRIFNRNYSSNTDCELKQNVCLIVANTIRKQQLKFRRD